MARYTDAVCRLCRRAGEKLFLKGERCYTPKCGVEKRRKPPGSQPARRRRTSDWGTQLREKQKARQIYGVLERQFLKYYSEALRRPGITGSYLMQILEERLDNVAYRLNFADSRSQARQLVTHGHIKVNGKKVDIPSYRVRINDVVTWKESSKNLDMYSRMSQDIPRRPLPNWLALNVGNMEGTIISSPDMNEIDTGIDARLVVEFYSR
ncbi:MAG: 30S ribosomal protein S4 [Dehalococcoidia bacterium]|nr:30S ribosomal protein S4 [Dehalococcoidia bacterium]